MSDERVSDRLLEAWSHPNEPFGKLSAMLARECQQHRQREKAYSGSSDEPLTDAELIEIYDGDEYPPGSLPVRLAGECIRSRERDRQRERELREVVVFIRHSDLCNAGRRTKVCWCPSCNSEPQHVHSVYKLLAFCPHCGSNWNGGIEIGQCTCGFDALLEKYPWLRQMIQEVRG